jgi:hypothetical protein
VSEKRETARQRISTGKHRVVDIGGAGKPLKIFIGKFWKDFLGLRRVETLKSQEIFYFQNFEC